MYFKINRCEEAHKHLDRARRILAGLKDPVTIAQVDETRACVFLKQGRVAEAERVARSSIHRLEKGDGQADLVEALITHGSALARLGSYSVALSTFRRAIALAESAGNINWAAQAALTAFQEMGQRLTAFERQNLTSGGTLSDEIRSLEHDMIKHALLAAQGSVTYAARTLGMSHQSLNYILETRHKDLLGLRSSVRRRRLRRKRSALPD